MWTKTIEFLPGCALCEKIWFSGHEFGPESSHFLLHLPHLSIKPFSDVAKLCIDDAEVSQLDGYITFYSTLSHFAYLLVEQVNPLCDVGVSHAGTFTFFVHALYHGLGMPVNRVLRTTVHARLYTPLGQISMTNFAGCCRVFKWLLAAAVETPITWRGGAQQSISPPAPQMEEWNNLTADRATMLFFGMKIWTAPTFIHPTCKLYHGATEFVICFLLPSLY